MRPAFASLNTVFGLMFRTSANCFAVRAPFAERRSFLVSGKVSRASTSVRSSIVSLVRCNRHWHHDYRRFGCEICTRRLDYPARTHHLQGSRRRSWSQSAPHCGHCHRPLEQHHPPGDRICCPAFPEVIALHVEPNEHSELLQDDWEHYVEQPFRAEARNHPSSRSCLHPIALS